MQACRLRSHTVDVTPPQAATKIMAGLAEQQTEWRNQMADGMQNGRMAGMATYVLFMVHTDTNTNTDTNTDTDTDTDTTLIFYI